MKKEKKKKEKRANSTLPVGFTISLQFVNIYASE
jgi:hypothetical protein